MVGNVTEWVQDAIRPHYPGGDRVDPLQDDDQGGRRERVVRDAGYAAAKSMLAVYYRASDGAAQPDVRNLGLRVGRSASD
jgi:formylglycine-generating enzyme required for sulfatase activity